MTPSPRTSPSSPIAAPADADAGNWVDRLAPEPAKPYLRLMRADRPVGTWLLLLPCWLGLALALVELSSGDGLIGPPIREAARFAVLFAIGAFVMRGAGCAYNDIVDRDIDAQVERTALRPIPSGQITLRQAVIFTLALCLIGLIVLLQFNRFTIFLGLGSLGLVALYPFAKRVTYWPQAWLGLTFNWGALVGYGALTGSLSWPAYVLYGGAIAWTIGYDTIYAHQDKEDDALIGVKSTALRFGNHSRTIIAGFYMVFVASIAGAGLLAGASIYFLIALLPAALHFGWQLWTLNTEDPGKCLAVFKSNRDAGFLLLAALLLETFVFKPYF